MNLTKSMVAALALGSAVTGAVAAQDWQAQRLQEAERVAAEHEYRWQQRERRQEGLRAAPSEAMGDTRREQQYRRQKLEQKRQQLPVSASNAAGGTTMSNRGPR